MIASLFLQDTVPNLWGILVPNVDRNVRQFQTINDLKVSIKDALEEVTADKENH